MISNIEIMTVDGLNPGVSIVNRNRPPKKSSLNLKTCGLLYQENYFKSFFSSLKMASHFAKWHLEKNNQLADI